MEIFTTSLERNATSTTCLEWNVNIHNYFGMKWKHSQLFWTENETFTTSLEWNRTLTTFLEWNGTFTTFSEWKENIHNLFGMKWKNSQFVYNEMETFTVCFQWDGNIHKMFIMKWKHWQTV